MHPTSIFLLMVSVIGAARSQSWAGTYTADSSCDTSSCCCMSGQVVVTSSSANVYTVTSGASGQCNGTTTFSGTLSTSGYTESMVVGTDTDILTLSSDSHTVTVTDSMNPACSGKGVKNGAIKQHANIVMLFAIALAISKM